MISVALTDGLANRMFQYAFGVGLANRLHRMVHFDQCHYCPNKDATFEDVDLRDAFPNIHLPQTPQNRFALTFRNDILGLVYLRASMSKLGIERYVYEKTSQYDENIYNRCTWNCQLVGHWQSEKYFNECRKQLLKEFTFLPMTEERNLLVAELMAKTHSVAIHVRKGKDYMALPTEKSLCDMGYYRRAINYMREHVDNPRFFVFTDNKDWVARHFTNIDYTLIDWNPVVGRFNFRDMQLMSLAKHQIVANSTYSWWGGYLNRNPQKIVIAPDPWWTLEWYRDTDIVPDEWVKLNSLGV
jgi:hypothetical protein